MGDKPDGHFAAYLKDENFQKVFNNFDKLKWLDIGDFKVPFIVIIGSQSQGKTSLLEQLFGVELPKGLGTVTRVPLEIQSRELSKDSEVEEECAFISYQGDKIEPRKIALKDVSAQVDALTKQLAGGGQEIKNIPITLKIYKEGLPDFTVVDLPGLVEIDESDPDKPQIIEDMVSGYITPSERIILNVVGCTNDAQSEKSTRMSRKVDKDWKRTLLVYTKVDMLRDAQSLVQKLADDARTIRVPKRSVFFVKNRDHSRRISLAQSQLDEMKWFEDNEDALEGIPTCCRSSRQLSRHLAHMYRESVLETLPGAGEKLRTMKHANTERLTELGEGLQTEGDCMIEYQQLMSNIFEKMRRSIKGSHIEDLNFRFDSIVEEDTKVPYDDDTDSPSKASLLCAVVDRISENFADQIRNLQRFRDYFSKEFLEEFKALVRACRGFDSLPAEIHPNISVRQVKKILGRVEEPTRRYVEEVFRVIEKELKATVRNELQSYRQLMFSITSKFEQVLDARKQECMDATSQHLLRETNRPITYNHYYMNGVQRLQHLLFGNKTAAQMPEHEPFLIVSIPKYRQKLQFRMTGSRESSDTRKIVPEYGNSTFNLKLRYRDSKSKWDICDKTNKVIDEATESQGDVRVVRWKHGTVISCGSLEAAEMAQVAQEDFSNLSNSEQAMFAEIVKVAAYWTVVQKRIMDVVPMIVYTELLDYIVRRDVQIQLTNEWLLEMTQSGTLLERMKEDETKAAERERLQEELGNIEEALAIVRDTYA